jgi:hypothetical protein
LNGLVGGLPTLRSMVPEGVAQDLVVDAQGGQAKYEWGMSPQSLYASIDHGSFLDDASRMACLQTMKYYFLDPSFAHLEDRFDFSERPLVVSVPTHDLPSVSVVVIIDRLHVSHPPSLHPSALIVSGSSSYSVYYVPAGAINSWLRAAEVRF